MATGQEACTISAQEPVGTTSTEALACNSFTLDNLVNGLSPTYINRTGLTLRSFSGIYAQINEILANSNGVPLSDGVYTAGKTYTTTYQYLTQNNIEYRVANGALLPYTTTEANASSDTNLSPFTGISNLQLTQATESLLGAGSKLYPISIGVSITNGDTVPSDITHLQVLVSGKVEIVNMVPSGTTGIITNLTSVGGTVGGTSVVFRTREQQESFTADNRKTKQSLLVFPSVAAMTNGGSPDGTGTTTAGIDVTYSTGDNLKILNTNTDLNYTVGTSTSDVVLGGGFHATLIRADQLKTLSTQGPRNIVRYRTANSVNVAGKHFPMGGFRYQGQYLEDNAPSFSTTDSSTVVDIPASLSFGMPAVITENWYAVFACANQGDSVPTFKTTPFLRVDSIVGNTITLRKAGEAIHTSTPQTYNWGVNGIANGVELLVVTETVDGRFNSFSGRKTTVLSSTNTTVTLSDIGNIGIADWILPAPTDEFTFYRYCCSFYYDTAELRNIADTGTMVGSRGIFDVSGTNTGAITVPERREPSGYIAPLATAVIIDSSGVVSTTTTGVYIENYATDGSAHDVDNPIYTKVSASNENYRFNNLFIPFSFGQQYYFSNAGLSSARVNSQQNIYGWLEP